MIDGVLPVDKPLGWTSHDAVARLRGVIGQRKIGHAGTLDPLATGVLVLVLGSATRLSSYLASSRKIYCAEVVLGVSTETDDGEGPILESKPLDGIDRRGVDDCLRLFVGTIDQRPPAHAAVHHRGKRLYQRARQGEAVEPMARQVEIFSLGLERFELPKIVLRVTCGPGTYIRSLARDLGEALGVGAYLHALRRMSSGCFTLDRCRSISELDDREAVISSIEPTDLAVLELPALVLDDQQVTRIRFGQELDLGCLAPGPVRLYGSSGALVGLARVDAGVIKPFRVFEGEVEFGAGS